LGLRINFGNSLIFDRVESIPDLLLSILFRLESIEIEPAESFMPVVSVTNELVSETPIEESGLICFAESVCWANDAAQKEKRKKRKKENRWLNSFSLSRKNKAVETVYTKKFSV
jgi:hypothetical protein